MIQVPEFSLEEILDHWLARTPDRVIKPLENHGGLSGSRLWKVETSNQAYCLRQWPNHPTAERFAEIHGLLDHLQDQRCEITPTVLRTFKRGSSLEPTTYIYANDVAWELQTWTPGEAVALHRFNTEENRTVLSTLAQVHGIAARPPHAPSAKQRRSEGLRVRLETLESLKRPAFQETLRELIAASDSPQTQRFKHMYGELLKTLPLVYEEVLRATDHELPLQWILGDVHREHFLFTNGQVTGLVDFGAVCVDSRVRDIARLLDSIALDDPERWEVGVQAYQQVSPLTPDELAVLAAFDSGGVAVAAYRWLHWLVVEGRQLAPEAVAARLEHLAGRLEALNRRGRASVLPPS